MGPRTAVLAAATLLGCGGARTTEEPPEPTYHADVAPLLRAHCLPCHRPGGVGDGDLSTFELARNAAPLIAEVTREGRMPPFPAVPEEGCPPLEGSRRLDPSQVELLDAWARTGAAEGLRPDTLPEMPASYGALTSVDAVLEADAPYLPLAETDDHRCFVVDPGLTADRYLTAYAVREDVPGIIHHVQLWALETAEAEAAADALDGSAPGAGYPCAGDIGVPGRYLSVWAPNDPVRRHPAGTGMLLAGGRRLVLQIHYNDHGVGAPDRTRVELELAAQVIDTAEQWTLSAPNLSLPPGLESVTAAGTLEVGGGPPYRLWGARAHMHTLGTAVRVTVGDSVGSRCLLSIPTWDPAWQLMYFFSEPITIASGDRLAVSCTYDTTSRTQTVQSGMRESDEMCFAFFYVSR